MIRLRSLWVVSLFLASHAARATDGTGPLDPPGQAGNEGAASGAPLGRAAFVREVLRQNPTLESARQGVRAALARVRAAGVLDDPMVDVGVAPLSIGSQARVGWEVGVSERLPWFGKRALETAAESADAEAAKSDYEATERDLALSAVVLYDQYFVAARSIDINEAHIELLRTLKASAVAGLEAGRASLQDPLAAEVELTHREHDAIRLASERDVVIAQMNELLHREPDAPLPAPPRELVLPEASPDRGGDALSSRPEIAALRRRARAERARADRAARDAFPDFTVSTSYSSMWDMPEHRWTVGLGFNLPVFSGRRAGARDEAFAMQAKYDSDAARAEAAVKTEVFVAKRSVEQSRHVVRLFEERLLPVARDQVDAARAGFIASRNPFNVVLEAEQNLRNVELEYQMARAECDRHQGELDRALGRIPGLEGEARR